ncbi:MULTISPECIES: hypothetical protein [unclassified Lentimonas]|uniref:hypothetical protein n=1 Tax=unclassified Lentimonas TaxID=2630993 RepID=UPI00132A3BD2|nr:MULTISPECIES: hypothetical protein [unclassified Lentimonas]CAA6676980.1 Unannotated [Lentimonas sp. CC4]CAA6686786.1 Unannotated [Lentimonas sp. CC6]CAA7075636.1 Unannotated [Lentimonas sp. CC4]CAA7168206.1 Unannotated [Lentimonas sp. CC21]CAA7181643.1 Unannotated [Lentimonas sp. CC8]
MRRLLTLLLLLSSVASAAPDASQWTKPRNIHTVLEQPCDDRVEVKRTAATSAAEGAMYSPNEAYWLKIQPVDPESEEQRLVISGAHHYTILLRGSYMNFPTQAHWINEKLLFIRVWWGRVLGRDMIFDVEAGKFIYQEGVHDGTILYQQTRQALDAAESR